MKQMRIALVGPMGVGKSTVAAVLASDLEVQWIDLDREIESRSGRTIPEIFGAVAEEGFRRIETATLRTLTDELADSPCVLATGGGVVTTEPARSILRDHWDCVWLKATEMTLLGHLRHQMDHRPLLRDSPCPKETIRKLSADREAWYRDVAKWQIAVDDREPDEIASQICQLGGWTKCSD